MNSSHQDPIEVKKNDYARIRKMFNSSTVASLEDVKKCRRATGEDIRCYSIRLRKVVDRCGENIFNNESSRANAVLAQFKQGIEDTHLSEDLVAANTLDEAIAAYKRIDDLRTTQAAARARNGASSQNRSRSPPPRRHESPYNDRSRRPVPLFNRDQRLVGAIKGTRQEKESENERLEAESSRVSYVSGQSPRPLFPNPPMDDRFGQPFYPDRFCEFHRTNGHRTSDCRGVQRKQGYYDALSGEPSQPPPSYPQYPAMAYRGPGQNGTPYGNNRPYNPANSTFNPSAPPFKPLNSPNPVRNPLSTSARGRGQEAQTPRGGYRGRGGRGNPPFRGPTPNPQMPHHNVYSLDFAVEAEKDTGGPNDSGEDTNDESNGSFEGNLMEMGIPLSPRKSQDFHRVNMISSHNPRISQVQGPQPTPSTRRQNQRKSNGNQPMPARDYEAPGTSQMDDRSPSEATNQRTRDSVRFRPWMVEPSAPEVAQGRTGRGSPSQQFEDFQRRYEEWDLNVLEVQVGRKNEYPAPVLRPIRWNSSAPNDQRQSENWGKITAYRFPDFSAADSGPSFGFTGTDEPLWDSYTQFLVVKKDFMDREIPAFLPRAQAKSYCRYRK